MKLRCDKIEATAATQIRKKLDKSVIETYTEDVKSGCIFPPLDVFCEKNSERYILADGFHRHRAFINADHEEVEVTVHEGGMHEALIFACGANSYHGLQRSNKDKHHAVEMCLKDPEISQYNRQEIADICHVTKRFVQKLANKAAIADPADDVNGTEPGSTQKASDDDVRPAKDALTQAEVETGELRQALSTMKAFPYGGADVGERMELGIEDAEDLEYVSAWCAHAVLIVREKK